MTAKKFQTIQKKNAKVIMPPFAFKRINDCQLLFGDIDGQA
jgi:hypothetical protein